MSRNVSLIGLEPAELHWVRLLIGLLRHSDPGVPELSRQALQYLTNAAGQRALAHVCKLDQTG